MNPASPGTRPEVPGLPDIPEHELLRAIASGAYGQVWLARNRLGAYRAVKIVHRASFDHDRPFEREFAGIKAFEPISRSHKGLVHLLQVGRDDEAGYFYYVMELADDLSREGTMENAESSPALRFPGGYAPRTLASELQRRGRLPLGECIEIGLSLAKALAHLHSQGLVHRDIKPSNIIFVQGMPKLADVGLVAGLGQSQSFVGTEGFIAPEGPGTPQGDLYSLGIVLYVLSTGKNHQDFPEPLPDLSSQKNHAQWLEFNAVVHKACQARLRDRYQTAEQLCGELVLLQQGQSIKGKRALLRRRQIRKHLGLATLSLLLLIAVLQYFHLRKYAPRQEAVRLYELGRWHYYQLTPAHHTKALDYLSRAALADPAFIEPYGELAGIYLWTLLTGLCSEQEREQMTREIADKVIAMNPNRAEGHIALSVHNYLKRDWKGAETEITRAIQLGPNMPISHQFYGYYLTMEGRMTEAHRETQLAETLSPPFAARVSAIVASWTFVAERRLDLAIAQLQQLAVLDPTYVYGHSYLGDCYEAQSNYVAAIKEYKTASMLVGDNTPRMVACFDAVSQACKQEGWPGYLREWVELILADRALPKDQQIFAETDLAGYYAMLGENAKALDEIEKHFDVAPQWCKIKYEPLYDSLHDEPRFKALVKRAGLEP